MKKNKILFFIILTFISFSCNKKPANQTKETTKEEINNTVEQEKQILENIKDADTLLQKARFYLELEEFSLAIRSAAKAAKIDSITPAAYVLLSEIYLEGGNLENSFAMLEKAKSIDKNYIPLLNKTARFHLIIQDYESVFLNCKKSIKIDELNPEAYYLLGIAFLEQGDTARAIKNLLTAVSQDANYFDAYLRLANVYEMRKPYMAKTYLEHAIDINPNNVEAQYISGVFYQNNNEYDKALQHYDKIISIDTTFADAHFNSGYIYLVYLSDYDKAIKFFDKAFELEPTNSDALFNRGYAFELKGNIAKAAADYHKVLKIDKSHRKATEALGLLGGI